ncbi:MAG: ABC transporter substrate-binding protein [Bacteroidales bacterium]|nr:ABC transporter substrate-binding protein [Bacteroidales bacterium]
MKHVFLILVITLLTGIMFSCGGRGGNQRHGRIIKDSTGRAVRVPDTIKSVVALRSGALRLVCYMGMADRVGYIEGNEKRRNVPYLMAYPGLKEKDVIGAGNNYDTELLAASGAGLIVATFMSGHEADELQKATGKPVFLLEYGDMKNNMDELFKSLTLLGDLFYRQNRADSLVQYINNTINDYKTRSAGNDSVTAYTGGVAYRGSHGISSTEPGYPPYRFLSVNNVAESLGEVVSSPMSNQENAFIDIEQLLIWDPDYIFLDAAGEPVWHQEIDKRVLRETLGSFSSGNVYSVLPYNWYTTNYENVLCNTWFVGKTVYPDAFNDIDIEAKCREIYSFFLGTDVYDEMYELYSPFRQLIKGEERE